MNDMTLVSGLVKDTFIPRMFPAKQIFPRPRIEAEEIPKTTEKLLEKEPFASMIQPGMRIAITVGSRGIANEALIVKSLVNYVLRHGGKPFLVPAMGSHGGATAEGQKAIIAGYGITEATMGCPVVSSMEVAKVGVNAEGVDVYIDRHALEADGIIVNCRIKPHTSFRGKYESGMMKMMAIGLGKQYGASVCHEAGFGNMAKNVELFGRTILERAPILFGFATLENAYDETARLVAVEAKKIPEEEPKLLQEAFDYMPRILVDSCDVLVVDRIGKNYSGDGMDPNITGTFCTPYATGGIKSQRVAVLDLSDETHGNAMGIGLASATTQRVYEKMDFAAMYPNAITAAVLLGVRIPMVMRNAKEAIQVCIKSCSGIDKKNPRVVRIQNTLSMERIWLSEAYLEEIKEIPELIKEGDPKEMEFLKDGNLW